MSAAVSAAEASELGRLSTGADYWTTAASERFGLRTIRLADGPHGLRVQDDDNPDHLGLGRSIPATCFPPAVALASSWDEELIEEVGAALGLEARAQGVDVLLGPGLNLKRSPLCGRNFEYFSEDPLLAGLLAAAMIRGIQRSGVAATPKHFALNNQETERMTISADVDPRPLHEIYLRAFEIAVREGQPWAIMSSYNRINGVHASQSDWLLTRLLRDDWGFDGLVVSDWSGVYDPVAAVAAGLDLRMPGQPDDSRVSQALAAGRIERATLERVVERLKRLGERTAPPATLLLIDEDVHHAIARRAAAESAVLLHNRRGLLPLDLSTAGRVAVIGEMARTPRYQGAGSSAVKPIRLVSLLDALAPFAAAFEQGYAIGEGDREGLQAKAIAVAADSDIVLMMLGLPPSEETEGKDRRDIDLPADQIALLRAVAAVNPRVVVLLSNGSAIKTAAWRDEAGALIEFWLTGQAQGEAMLDVLTGAVNPSGRLAETIPLRLEDTPAYLDFPGEASRSRYGEGIYVGYRWYDARRMEVDYPFGFGLSYTQFDYANLDVAVHDETDPVAVTVRLDVTNTGERDGADIVQVYGREPNGELRMPERELRAFAKVCVPAGQTVRVEIPISRQRLRHYHPVDGWFSPVGAMEVQVGASSRDIRLSAAIELPGRPPRRSLTLWSSLGQWLDDPNVGPRWEGLIAGRGGLGGRTADMLNDPIGRDTVRAIPMICMVQFPGVPVNEADVEAILESSADEVPSD